MYMHIYVVCVYIYMNVYIFASILKNKHFIAIIYVCMYLPNFTLNMDMYFIKITVQ